MPKMDKAPPTGKLKCNWDAVLISGQKIIGVGVVVRDDQGRVVASLARAIPGIDHPTVAESWAAWLAVELYCVLGFQKVSFEGDSMILVSALNSEDHCWSAYGQLIEDTKIKLNSFSTKRLNHVPREANNVAHCLTKFALSQRSDNVWIEECPSFI